MQIVDISIIFFIAMLSYNKGVDLTNSEKVKYDSTQSVKIKGVHFSWHFDEDFLHCKVTAPTKGWVAIGFNKKNDLAGTNLIMAAAEKDFYKMDDRYIIAAANHKSIIELGGSEGITKRFCQESNGVTKVHFSMHRSVNDKFHHELNEGESYFILLAYSNEDDFAHHSAMRTSIQIKL
ncbi:hypothetical protein SanaruYs_26480 [Chryseotalea sanaruensis]|uniref:DOMON domain-containing protein n=1 Tax=Chryseotalea sanaruensis TaxID=2482724 RepID=A0A401UBY2_9BACT|nr:DOMON domain-containing protein [Chryseotalea sanaruensis]GCC52411.1 hypothetical protein SanaruYs_26480 [Chryseotalea sanaruensis]